MRRFPICVHDLIALLFIPCILAGCAERERAPTPPEEPDAAPANVVQITAIGLTFEAPEEIPSGWNTFEFTNEADMAHFAVIERLPDGIGIEQQQAEVAPVFQKGMDLLKVGKVDEALAAFGELPPWFNEVSFVGGPGLTAAGTTAETTVYLEPGNYLIECYVKTDGSFHSYNANRGKRGMVHGFTVTEAVSGLDEPVPTMRLTLSTERGIEVEGTPSAGPHVVAVRYEDQTVHENFVGHDVNLARLSPETDLDQVAAWMDWSRPSGLETPAPVQFLGGNQEMPAGSVGYFHVTLEPGRYAWISEVSNPLEKGMFVVFEVADE